MKIKIKKGDIVKIRAGKDRGKSGKVIEVDYKNNSVLVEGLNLFKKHKKPTREGEKGEIINVMRPIAIANVSLICPKCKNSVKVGYRFLGPANQLKVRYCKKCQESI